MANQQQGQQQQQNRDTDRGDNKGAGRQDDTRGRQGDDRQDAGMRGDDTRKM